MGIFVILLIQDGFKYYGDKYRKMKVLENYYYFFFYPLTSEILNQEKKIVEIEFYFIFFSPSTLDFR